MSEERTRAATDLCVVLTTCGSQQEARDLARRLLEMRLIACAQITETQSLYEWLDEIYDEAEWTLVMKTQRGTWPALEAAIRAAHSYETPEIVMLDAIEAHGPYRDWVAACLALPPQG